MIQRTTKLEELENGAPFTWGELTKIHRIFDYTFVEYHPHEYKNGRDTGNIDKAKKEYACYLNDKDICISGRTPDEALAICMAYKHDGRNSQAAEFFLRMIKAEVK